MTNKILKIREEVEKLKSQLLRGACSSQIAMETMCKEEAYNEVLSIIDSMQEETTTLNKDDSTPLSGGGMVVDSLQQPKFKIGDMIIHIDDSVDVIYKEHKVINVAKLGYVLDNGRTIELSDQDQWELVERKPLFKQGDILYKISDGSKIKIIDIVADQYKFECGDEFPHYEFFGYIENNYSKELVNRDLNKEIQHWREHYIKVKECGFQIDLRDIEAVARHFANWQKENLWKPADGDELPEIDREVIVLVKYSTQRNIHDKEYSTYRVEFGHRPNPNGWDGKSITTGNVEHYIPKTYDKGGWNIPNVKYWLDAKLPYEEK